MTLLSIKPGRILRSLAACLALGTAALAQAQTPSAPLLLSAFDNPGNATFAFDGDKNGNVVGYYYDSNFTAYGFIRNASGAYSQLIYPTAESTFARAMNDSGTIVGEATVNGYSSGWSYDMATATYTAISVPKAGATTAQSINTKGDIAGFATFYKQTGDRHVKLVAGFIYSKGRFRFIRVPDATYTYARTISDAGDVGGTYIDADGLQHTFVWSKGKFTTVDALSRWSSLAMIYGMDAAGNTVGTCADESFVDHACYYDSQSGKVTDFLVPGLSNSSAWDVKPGRVITGWGDALDGRTYGYVISLP